MLPLREYVTKFCDDERISTGKEEVCASLRRLPIEEIVSSVYGMLVEKKQFADITVRRTKKLKEAEEYLLLAAEAFSKEDDYLAINYHTIGLSLLPADSPLLPIVYSYRSASFFRLERYDACLIDLNRSLQANSVTKSLDPHMIPDLQERKTICVAQLKQEKLDRINKERVLAKLTSEAAGVSKEDETKKESAEKKEDEKCPTEQPAMTRNKKKKKKKQEKIIAQKEVAKAMDEIDEGMIHPNYKDKFPLPIIADPNETIPNASAKVSISFSQDHGRHLVATDDIKTGELLIVERPYASVLFPQYYYSTCRYCFVRCEALISCPKCLLGTYCSESCRSKAFDEFHRVECPILHTLMKLEVIGSTHLALRILLIATKQGANLSSMMQHPTHKSPFETSYGPIEGQYLSEDYNNVHNLMDNYLKASSFVLFRKCYEVAVLMFLLKHTTFFGRSEDDTSEVDIETLTDEEIFVGTLLLKFSFLSICNSAPIKDLVETPAGDSEFYNTSLIGYGLYPLHSLMNHSCDPNTYSVSHKDSIVCYAYNPIKKGEQIFANYNWTYSRFEKKYRQHHLLDEYYFRCKCNACELDWGQKVVYQSMINRQLKRISNKVSEKELREYERKFKIFISKEGFNTSTHEDLDFLIDLISVYHRCVRLPHVTYIEAKECFSFLLARRGNIYDYENDYILCKLRGAYIRGNN